MKPWVTLASVATADGPLELRRRGERDFLIVIAGRVLMTSSDRRSEEVLARAACTGLTGAPRVLIGGLGMAYTLRAALDALPAEATVVVAELTAAVADWCRGPLAVLTRSAATDPRVTIVIDDVAHVIAGAAAWHYQAIVLDLYEGPYAGADDPIFGAAALERIHAALAPGGVVAVWSEEAAPAFARRLAHRFTVETMRDGTQRSHFVYVGRRR
ncbi:MAG: spermidine synthase [Kofleriaceae bacterium]